MPIGNGRLGAMLFGGTDEEVIVLNESGMWSGSPQESDRPHAADALPEIRRLLFAGENAAAEQLMNEKFTCVGQGSGHGGAAKLPYGCYQTLGTLRLRFVGDKVGVSPRDYRRELDLTSAVVQTRYSLDDIIYASEAFVSFPNQVLVYRLQASEPGALSFDVSLDRLERSTTTGVGENELLMKGQLDDGKNGDEGVRFAARVRALNEDGTVSVQDNVLSVREATTVVLMVSAATDMRQLATQPFTNLDDSTSEDLDQATTKPFKHLLDAHITDYRKYYDRVSLRLGSAEQHTHSEISTDERLRANWVGGNDNSLAVLYFNFGRYLLISASRPGGRPANLQGIWAEEIQTPWNGDWHLNVNVQMNYWPAEVCNLSELHEPLFRFIESLVEPGSQTAHNYYAAEGWVAHVLANPWGFTSPSERASWGSTCTGSAWLCQHMWDHYLFTQDREFLQRAYPIMKGAAQFYLDTLVEDPQNDWFVTAPSSSPENGFYTSDGAESHICVGAAGEMQLMRYLFNACQEAATILDVDEQFRERLATTTRRLAPTRVASDGRIMEWDQEYTEVDPQHRHVAHLWGLYPGDEIGLDTTPDLAAAAIRSLNSRGDSGTGWALANKMAMWARLHDGVRAHHLLQNHLRPVRHGEGEERWVGGTYPNLFDAHPPFQIDGNFGATAAIAEMLVQSSPPDFENGGLVEIHLLPALPDAWPEGSFSGLRARGGFEVNAKWSDGRLDEAEVASLHGLPVRIRYGSQVVPLELDRSEKAVLDGNMRLLPVQSKQ